MSIKIEFRYAVLTALVMLLWLIVEYVIGLEDTYIIFYPYASILIYTIYIFTYRLALVEKIEERFNKLTFMQAFISCFLITVFVCILTIPVQMVFTRFINPDFFQNMIEHTISTGKRTPEQAAYFFNPGTFTAETVLANFVIGTVIGLVLALRMRTVK